MFKKTIALLLVFAMTMGSAFATAYDPEGIKKEIYENASLYKTEFSFEYIGDTSTLSQLMNSSIEEALQNDDYLLYLIDHYEANYSYSSDRATINMTIQYRSTAEQEAFVRAEVERILVELQLEGLSDYQRVEKIANYMDTHFDYDDSLTKYDAYSLITTKEGVCQAYGELFYLLAKGARIPVRNQSGELEGTPHLWNLVKINDAWYSIDVTNLDMVKGHSNVFMGTLEMKADGFVWDELLAPAVEKVVTVDTIFNSQTYKASEIQDNIKPNIFAYQMSEEAKATQERISNFELYKSILSKYFANQPDKKSPAAYLEALNTFSKLKALNVEPEIVTYYENNFIELSYENDQKVVAYLNGNIAKSNTMVGKIATETTLKNSLKFLEETKSFIPKMLFDTERLSYFNKYMDTQIKNRANELIRYYMTQYKKTKKAADKTAYLALAKKYNIVIK